MAKAGESPNQEATDPRMWVQLVIDTLVRPRGAARQLLGLDLALGILVQAAVLTACLAMVLGYAAVQLSPPGTSDAVSEALIGQPLRGAALQLVMMAAAAGLTARIGRLFGGTGSLRGALALVVWLNMMMVILQVVQLAALLFWPPLAVLIALGTLFWALWAFVSFVAELHGFGNALLVLAGTVLTLIVLFFGIAMLLAILGITPKGAG